MVRECMGVLQDSEICMLDQVFRMWKNGASKAKLKDRLGQEDWDRVTQICRKFGIAYRRRLKSSGGIVKPCAVCGRMH